MTSSTRATAHDYDITLEGQAGPAVRAAFREFDVTMSNEVTVLHGRLEDQAALHGLLQRIQDMGISILEVRLAPQRAR